MYHYGFELEGFALNLSRDAIVLPPLSYPTDGFPGLIEIRTNGGQQLDDAYSDLLKNCWSRIDMNYVRFNVVEHSFSSEEKRLLRKRNWHKNPCDVRNLYGKKPRDLKGKTIASFQINVSNCTAYPYTDEKGVPHPAVYDLLDVPKIVTRLDDTFENEIKMAGRQKGEYCIKGNRLEYRSLPNQVCEFDLIKIPLLLKKIKSAVEDE